ncbi:MAG: CARDB domain-containing protein [Solirubrobacterales bacterium]
MDEISGEGPAPSTSRIERSARASRRERPPRRPRRQQVMARRGIALGGALILIVLIVLGVRGCLNARHDRALEDYARNVTEIVDGTQQTSKRFFDRMEDPGNLSVTEFVTETNADRSAMDSYLTRVDDLSAPGEMGHAQNALELTYELRAAAFGRIADKMSTALGEAGREQAVASIANQMRTLLASDALYSQVVRPEINGVLANQGIEGSDVPASLFIPDGDTKWLDPATIDDSLSQVSGASAAATPGLHGTGLIGASIGGTTLTEGVPATISATGPPAVDVQVQNQGGSTENNVTVSVSVDGGSAVTQSIESIAPGEIQTATVQLTSQPKGSVTIDVEVQAVPGEQVTDNNKASYDVTFG